MESREPITWELRRVMSHTTMAGCPLVELGEFEFGHRCDAIDAVHAALERENAELRARVAELDKRGDSMHEIGSATVSITNEVEAWADDGAGDLAALRDLARRLREVEVPGERAGDGGATLRALDDLAAGVRDLALSAGIVVTGQEPAHELAELVGRWIDGAVELPVDAEGEVIHVGDELDGYGKTIEVVELRYGRSGWVLISRDGNAYADTFAFARHRAATLGDVPRLPAQRDRELGSARVWQYTRDSGTCHPIISDNLAESEGTGDAWADCSECGHLLFVLTDPTSEPPNYCPNCGRKVVDE